MVASLWLAESHKQHSTSEKFDLKGRLAIGGLSVHQMWLNVPRVLFEELAFFVITYPMAAVFIKNKREFVQSLTLIHELL